MAKRKTTEEFKKEVYTLVGNEYSVLGSYINNKTKIKMKHNICNNEYEVKPNDFQQGDRCPKCYTKAIKKKLAKTTEEFKKEVYVLVKDEYSVLGNYINNKTKIKMKHNICNNEYEVRPNRFIRGDRCPKCAIKNNADNKRKTTEEFKKEVYNLVGNEYSVLGKYENCFKKLLMKHNKCGNTYEVKPNDFQQGVRCTYCSIKNRTNKRRKTTNDFKKEVYDLVGNEYSVLGEYETNKTKIKMKHNNCNKEYLTTPHNFITTGNRCPYCYGKIKKTTDEFKKEVYDLVKDEYSVLSEYTTNKTKIKMKHNKCKHIYEVYPVSFLRGARCPKCFGTPKKTTDIFKKELYDLVKDEYLVLGKYINNKTKIKLKHNKCNKEFDMFPLNFLKGQRCPHCKRSKGEERIRKYLEDNHIRFKEQYSFDDCKNIYPLRFDFMLEDDSGRIILIEYDGEFHYTKQYYQESFNQQRLRDKIKDDYCNNNDNIDLYRISYKEFNNIETILEEIINKYN